MSNSIDTVQSVEDTSPAVENRNDSADSEQNSSQENYVKMRTSPRKQFQYSQRIAPMLGKILPQVDDYLEVECNDISSGGISFFLKRKPGCTHFVIALGQKPTVTLLIAQVMNIKEVKHNHQQMYLVGCKFIDRAQE
jgi:hypothetical protein